MVVTKPPFFYRQYILYGRNIAPYIARVLASFFLLNNVLCFMEVVALSSLLSRSMRCLRRRHGVTVETPVTRQTLLQRYYQLFVFDGGAWAVTCAWPLTAGAPCAAYKTPSPAVHFFHFGNAPWRWRRAAPTAHIFLLSTFILCHQYSLDKTYSRCSTDVVPWVGGFDSMVTNIHMPKRLHKT